MQWNDFEEATTLDCEAHDTWEELEHAFETADQSTFEIDRHIYDHALSSTEPNRAAYLTPHSLYCNILEREGDKFILGRPTELYQRINVTEDMSRDHVVFYPDCYHARLWKRHDDDIDLALLFYWEKGGSRDTEPDGSSRVHYVEYGHGPWKSSLMTLDGEARDWTGFREVRKSQLVPRVPMEMRWYLTKLGVLDDAGINKLRPLTARWISY
ncbi:hypothetical protein HFO56_23360 [Rhizobium laguerreae]|uniref:hypothetical protein n=1 Tax=Rhizobium laguerreae TaxID=1076926 RepID=UPI001C925972|nr:hypothetical protein [Rhizobium laguerreae]MBY3155264.1 hypothetical protein [Rhizobium laguerreae]MBY3432687.1 hypothetical protein [Rhizobium laguerreae]